MNDTARLTDQTAAFIETAQYSGIPDDAIAIGRRCILDCFGLYIAGTAEASIGILVEEARATGGAGEATLLGAPGIKVPSPLAARVLGTAGHSHDWDDTQVSHDPAHIYGLLTHPSVPALTGALGASEMIGGASGRDLMLAFQVGFEVECKISEWMLPDHYLRGHHSSGTVGTFGACAGGLLEDDRLEDIIQCLWKVEEIGDVRDLLERIQRPCGDPMAFDSRAAK